MPWNVGTLGCWRVVYGIPMVEWPAYHPVVPLQYMARSATIAAGTTPGAMASLTTSVEKGLFLSAS